MSAEWAARRRSCRAAARSEAGRLSVTIPASKAWSSQGGQGRAGFGRRLAQAEAARGFAGGVVERRITAGRSGQFEGVGQGDGLFDHQGEPAAEIRAAAEPRDRPDVGHPIEKRRTAQPAAAAQPGPSRQPEYEEQRQDRPPEGDMGTGGIEPGQAGRLIDAERSGGVAEVGDHGRQEQETQAIGEEQDQERIGGRALDGAAEVEVLAGVGGDAFERGRQAAGAQRPAVTTARYASGTSDPSCSRAVGRLSPRSMRWPTAWLIFPSRPGSSRPN